MIRVFLPLLLAVVAFFGPWTPEKGGAFHGFDSAGSTVDCLLELEPSVTGPCAPEGNGLAQQLIGYTVLAGAGAGILSILGLLPLIGRITSIAVVGAGGVGLAASGMALMNLVGDNAIPFAEIGGGAYGSLVLGLAALWSGFDGIRHGNDD